MSLVFKIISLDEGPDPFWLKILTISLYFVKWFRFVKIISKGPVWFFVSKVLNVKGWLEFAILYPIKYPLIWLKGWNNLGGFHLTLIEFDPYGVALTSDGISVGAEIADIKKTLKIYSFEN